MMKSKIWVLLAVLLSALLVLISCGEDGGTESSSATGTSSESVSESISEISGSVTESESESELTETNSETDFVTESTETETDPEPVAGPVRIKLAEFNIKAIEAGQQNSSTVKHRAERMQEYLAGVDADVFVLPEVNSYWMPYLSALEGYRFFGKTASGAVCQANGLDMPGDTWDIGNLILWKEERFDLVDTGAFWMSSTPDIPGSDRLSGEYVCELPRAVSWVILCDRATGQEFFVAGAHLPVQLPKSQGTDKQEMQRLAALTILMQLGKVCPEEIPLLITGDWNCRENSKGYQQMLDGGLSDARYATEDRDVQASVPSGKLSAKPIDQCFFRGEVEVVRQTTYRGEAGEPFTLSDHYPVIFELVLYPEK